MTDCPLYMTSTSNASAHRAFDVHAECAMPATPLVFDSPHSWRDWPADAVSPIAPESALLTSWDAWIDELWAQACDGMAPVVSARFQRAYIDANRARDDIDPALLAAPWPGAIKPTDKSRRGFGLIRRYALPGVPIYAEALTVEDVARRIAHCYDPYHAKVASLLDAAHRQFGLAVLIDCHSMKSVGNAMNEDSGQRRPDVVVSDREGTCADPFLMRWIAASFEGLGYRVQVNHPYRGGELVRRHGLPSSGRHAVQIEINRGLYMDELHFEPNAGYPKLVADLAVIVRQLRRGLAFDLAPQLSQPG